MSTPEGAALSAKLVAAARGVFSALRGVSYGRADFRVDAATGEPYFLEMNPNCGIFYPPGSFGSADFILSHDAEGERPPPGREQLGGRAPLSSQAAALHQHGGLLHEWNSLHCWSEFCLIEVGQTFPYSIPPSSSTPSPPPAERLPGHAGFVHLIIETALARRAELDAQRTCVVTYHPRTGYGLTAARELAAGETVLLYEGKGHTLISRSKVQREWGAADKESFDRYAYPISDDVWAIWSENPDDWRPINHSCDPNAWLVGECWGGRAGGLAGGGSTGSAAAAPASGQAGGRGFNYLPAATAERLLPFTQLQFPHPLTATALATHPRRPLLSRPHLT